MDQWYWTLYYGAPVVRSLSRNLARAWEILQEGIGDWRLVWMNNLLNWSMTMTDEVR